MLLEGKTAVIYGGAGSIGSAAATAFAREGAHVYLAGRTQATLDRVVDEIRRSGGSAQAAVVDALDADQVGVHADAVAAAAGGIDISLNVIAHGDVQGTPLIDMDLDDFRRPVVNAISTTFLTACAAARHMRKAGGGVILIVGGAGPQEFPRDYRFGGLVVAFEAMETMRRQLATELGPDGIRVLTMRSGGFPSTIPESFEGRQAIVDGITKSSLLGRAAELDDVCHALVFAASDRARVMTSATLNVSGGALPD
jgi:NAD(P)-dependent dehydrogenase (short-subunit alcohol dehydrogenase family)